MSFTNERVKPSADLFNKIDAAYFPKVFGEKL